MPSWKLKKARRNRQNKHTKSAQAVPLISYTVSETKNLDGTLLFLHNYFLQFIAQLNENLKYN